MKHMKIHLIELRAQFAYPHRNYVRMDVDTANVGILLNQLSIKEGHNGGWFKPHSARIAVF